MKCLSVECDAPIIQNLRFCAACGADAGAPNVRVAKDPAEVAVLDKRYMEEVQRAQVDAYEAEFLHFLEIAKHSRAIICMPSARLAALASDPASLLSTFGLQIEGETRVPLDNRFDAVRASVEEAYFPNYSKDIRFAALGLSDTGHEAYGSCSVALKDSAIASRASVFEHPLFKFVEIAGLMLSQTIPPGHRASWPERSRLAAVKLSSSLKGANDDRMAELLLPAPADTLGDCVEVHIHGPISRHSIASVVMTPEKRRADKLLQQVIAENFAEVGVAVRYAS